MDKLTRAYTNNYIYASVKVCLQKIRQLTEGSLTSKSNAGMHVWGVKRLYRHTYIFAQRYDYTDIRIYLHGDKLFFT